MDHTLLSQVVSEANRLLTGRRIERVYQAADGSLIILAGRGSRARILLIDPSPSVPRLYLAARRPSASERSAPFVLYLRSHLPGASITGMALLGNDRIADLRFERSGKSFRLLAELFGSRPNLVVVDADDRILAAWTAMPPASAGGRAVLPGIPYLPPAKRIPRAVGTAPEPSRAPDGEAGAEAPFSRTAEIRCEQLVHAREEQQGRRTLEKEISRALARAERKASAIEDDLASADRADQYRLAGELILANLRSLRRGAQEAVLAGHDGTTMEVRLDPALTPQANAERYFRRFKKARAGQAVIASRLEEARRTEMVLREAHHELDGAADIVRMRGIREQLVRAGILPEREGPAARQGSGPTAPPYRTFSRSGWEILVGRTAAGNDQLTFRIARPDDLWLHAEGIPGSHVLVRNPGRQEVPAEVLEMAAALAAYFSKGRSAANVPVTYTRARHVRRPKGAPPGTVTLVRRSTITVRPLVP